MGPVATVLPKGWTCEEKEPAEVGAGAHPWGVVVYAVGSVVRRPDAFVETPALVQSLHGQDVVMAWLANEHAPAPRLGGDAGSPSEHGAGELAHGLSQRRARGPPGSRGRRGAQRRCSWGKMVLIIGGAAASGAGVGAIVDGKNGGADWRCDCGRCSLHRRKGDPPALKKKSPCADQGDGAAINYSVSFQKGTDRLGTGTPARSLACGGADVETHRDGGPRAVGAHPDAVGCFHFAGFDVFPVGPDLRRRRSTVRRARTGWTRHAGTRRPRTACFRRGSGTRGSRGRVRTST